MNPPPIVVLDAPSNLGLRPPAPGKVPGVYRLPAALRAQGLLARLGALDGGRVVPPAYSPDPDPATGFRNGTAIAGYSLALAERVAEIARAGSFPLVLGGDCSILLGDMLALRMLGRYGLVFIDGHDDYTHVRTPEKYTGYFTAAGLDLALVTGRHGPGALTNLRGLGPYVPEANVVVFGYYDDPNDAEMYAVEGRAQSKLHFMELNQVRGLGAGAAAQAALARLAAQGLDQFWLHLDADVLDATVMPAVDSPNPNGLSFAELTEALRVFLGSGRAVGLEVTIFDPDLDPTGEIAAAFTSCLVEAFSQGGVLSQPGSAP
jgi:arginase